MKLFSLILAAVIATGSLIAYGATARKVMVYEPVADANCVLDSNDTVNRRAQTIEALATITGACATSWTSAVNFSNGYEAVRLGKVDTACDKHIYYHVNAALTPGRAGFLDTFAAATDGANPCLHSDGKIYRKYTANTDP